MKKNKWIFCSTFYSLCYYFFPHVFSSSLFSFVNLMFSFVSLEFRGSFYLPIFFYHVFFSYFVFIFLMPLYFSLVISFYFSILLRKLAKIILYTCNILRNLRTEIFGRSNKQTHTQDPNCKDTFTVVTLNV